MCVNTYYLDKYLEDEDKKNLAYEDFINLVELELEGSGISEIVEYLRQRAKDFKGFDFSDVLNDVIKDYLDL